MSVIISLKSKIRKMVNFYVCMSEINGMSEINALGYVLATVLHKAITRNVLLKTKN